MGKRICFREGTWQQHENRDIATITGKTTRVTQDRMLISKFALYSHVESITKGATVQNDRDIICLVYPPSAVQVDVRIATSLISPEQAKVNLNREIDAV